MALWIQIAKVIYWERGAPAPLKVSTCTKGTYGHALSAIRNMFSIRISRTGLGGTNRTLGRSYFRPALDAPDLACGQSAECAMEPPASEPNAEKLVHA